MDGIWLKTEMWLEYGWNIGDIWLENMARIWMEMAKIWLEGWNVVGWLKYGLNIPGICLEYRLENMAETWLEYGRNMAGKGEEYSWTIAGIWLG